ncbi:hypothetical protein, partial [Streptomyces sp. NPDC056549]|uniref:hypothetical protein n=1 Tax=Streptomyces sp. NPDC056549 TaxID=3345864 RepID=UPI003674BCE4
RSPWTSGIPSMFRAWWCLCSVVFSVVLAGLLLSLSRWVLHHRPMMKQRLAAPVSAPSGGVRYSDFSAFVPIHFIQALLGEWPLVSEGTQSLKEPNVSAKRCMAATASV